MPQEVYIDEKGKGFLIMNQRVAITQGTAKEGTGSKKVYTFIPQAVPLDANIKSQLEGQYEINLSGTGDADQEETSSEYTTPDGANVTGVEDLTESQLQELIDSGAIITK